MLFRKKTLIVYAGGLFFNINLTSIPIFYTISLDALAFITGGFSIDPASNFPTTDHSKVVLSSAGWKNGRKRGVIMKKTILLILSVLIVLMLAASPVLAADRVRVGERINVLSGSPETFPAGEPFHIAHGWGLPPVPMDFVLFIDGEEVSHDFIEKTVVTTDPLYINRIWVHNFPDGMNGTHTFTGHWKLDCHSALDGGFVDECTGKELVIAVSSTLVVDFLE
jgi:hypothetical protein